MKKEEEEEGDSRGVVTESSEQLSRVSPAIILTSMKTNNGNNSYSSFDKILPAALFHIVLLHQVTSIL